MAKEINLEHAEKLWKILGVTVGNLIVAPKQHKGNVIFCGYADIHTWLFFEQEPVPFISLFGNSIKCAGDEIFFDPKSGKGKKEREKHFFPHWKPSDVTQKAVITKKLVELVEIQEMVSLARARLGAALLKAQAE